MRSDVVKKGLPPPQPLSALCPGLHPGGAGAPLIGVVCSYNEIVPGHMNLDKIAEAVKVERPGGGSTPWSSPPSPCATASLYGPCGHEILPGHPGPDRRLHRGHDYGPPV